VVGEPAQAPECAGEGALDAEEFGGDLLVAAAAASSATAVIRRATSSSVEVSDDSSANESIVEYWHGRWGAAAGAREPCPSQLGGPEWRN